MRPTVLLFDIDGTLITTEGVGRRALEQAFDRVHGRPDACASFRFDGMTDYAILRRGLAAIGVEATAEAIDRVLALYVEVLAVEISRAEDPQYREHPGTREALALARERGMAVGLGTGNVREGARLKLERVGLFEQFQFGGFGCDHEERLELIRIGAQRGARVLGTELEQCRVVIIGDTPKDVAAALGIGAECIGMGTGSFSPEALLSAGATAAFADLTAPGALDALLER